MQQQDELYHGEILQGCRLQEYQYVSQINFVHEKTLGRIPIFAKNEIGYKNLTKLSKGSVYATPVIETGIQGYNAYKALQDARKNTSVFEPRVDTALGEAPISYYNKIMSELPEVDRSSAAGGGIMKMAGRSSGPAPESGPTPQGLDFLMKRGR